LTLVFASCLIRQRYIAGIAKIGEVTFHAGLNAALARLGVCAKLFHVSRTGFDVHSLEHQRLAALLPQRRFSALVLVTPSSAWGISLQNFSFRQGSQRY
jgi:hypothetical protein